MIAKACASQGDLSEKKTSFTRIGEGLYAFTAEGDPNTGVIIGDDSVVVIEAQATPRLARKVIDCIRSVTDKPLNHVVLTHYHAVRVLGASAYGAREIIMSDRARGMVAERGAEDWVRSAWLWPSIWPNRVSRSQFWTTITPSRSAAGRSAGPSAASRFWTVSAWASNALPRA